MENVAKFHVERQKQLQQDIVEFGVVTAEYDELCNHFPNDYDMEMPPPASKKNGAPVAVKPKKDPL